MTNPKSCAGDTESVGLDKLALAALRQADRISFHHSEGKSLIRATKEHKPTERDPFAPRETVITIACEARITDYDRGGCLGTDVYRDDLKGYTAFAWFSQAQYADCTWETTASILKVGDELTCHCPAAAQSRRAEANCELSPMSTRQADGRGPAPVISAGRRSLAD